MTLCWDTSTRPPAEQYAYWRHTLCDAFTPLRPVERGQRDAWRQPGLPGTVTSQHLGALNAAEIATCAQTIHHGRAEVERLEEEVVFVNLMLRGRCIVRQGRSEAFSPAGTFTIVDAAEEFVLDYLDPWASVSFRVPSARLHHRVQQDLRATTFSALTGMSAVLADSMRSAWSASTSVDEAQRAVLGGVFETILDAFAERTPVEAFVVSESRGAALRTSIERYVAQQLRFGDVSPTATAARFAISPRKLHQLYEGAAMSFSQTVMRLRVEHCAAELTASTGMTLTDLAARWGFADLSHLNRAFRTYLGMSPREYRSVAA
ncbi:AraC family transcriptional regulator [Microbacterium sp. SSW1-49]|uniref:AraC family transcriptional regulator n=1 Tax=Microbacterium croceum TaxID=2851645 RepID=A0ABT0FFC0_9MICO|nr:AraC family transcriptional regulator [Microbacterium croceum]MCK2036589.1 AraC family transcriptional regulator [Microbacterium croceum]